jgi:hypothetical protein
MSKGAVTAGAAIRRMVLALLFYGAFIAGAVVSAGGCFWMTYHSITQGELGSAFIMVLLGLLPSAFLWWLVKHGGADLKVRWGRLQASSDTQDVASTGLVGIQAIASPLGAVGQICFVIYLFTLHPLWTARIRASLDSAHDNWLTLIVVVVALGLEQWGGDRLLRTIPRPDGGLGDAAGLLHGLSRVVRVGFMAYFLGMGLAAAGLLQVDATGKLANNGTTAGIGMGIVLLMLGREAWLAMRFSTRSVEPQPSHVVHETAHWLGVILMYAMVEILLFGDGPMRDVQGGWAAAFFSTAILFPIFWVPLQLPQFLRHLTSASTIRQELAWWGSTAMVLLAVGQRFWSG